MSSLPRALALPRARSLDDISPVIDLARAAVRARSLIDCRRAFASLELARDANAVARARDLVLVAIDVLAFAATFLDVHDRQDVTRALEVAHLASAVVARRRELGAALDASDGARATTVLDDVLTRLTRKDFTFARDVPESATSCALALATLGDDEAREALRSSGAELGRFARASSRASDDLAQAVCVAFKSIDDGGFDAFDALLRSYDDVDDTAWTYDVARARASCARTLARRLERELASGAISPSARATVALKMIDAQGCGTTAVVCALMNAHEGVSEGEEIARAVDAGVRARTRDVAKWTSSSSSPRDVRREARAMAYVDAMATMSANARERESVGEARGTFATAACRLFSLAHGILIESRANARSPSEASRAVKALTTSTVFVDGANVARAMSMKEAVGTRAALATLATYAYDTARDVERGEWGKGLDEVTISNARASVHEFVVIALGNVMRAHVEEVVVEVAHALMMLEFARRTTTVEYAQLLGVVASVLSAPEPMMDSPRTVAFVSVLPDVSEDMSDDVASARVHLALRLLPFVAPKLSSSRIVRDVVPFVDACCLHERKHVLKAAHVAYAGIFYAHPELHGALVPKYVRSSLENYPAKTPIEPFIAAVAIITKLGDAGSDLGVLIAREISEKVRFMDAEAADAPLAADRDPPVEPLRRLLFQLITLVDFPLIPVVRDIVQDAVFAARDRSTRVRLHRELASVVARCPDYARKPAFVDWILRLSSKL